MTREKRVTGQGIDIISIFDLQVQFSYEAQIHGIVRMSLWAYLHVAEEGAADGQGADALEQHHHWASHKSSSRTDAVKSAYPTMRFGYLCVYIYI